MTPNTVKRIAVAASHQSTVFIRSSRSSRRSSLNLCCVSTVPALPGAGIDCAAPSSASRDFGGSSNRDTGRRGGSAAEGEKASAAIATKAKPAATAARQLRAGNSAILFTTAIVGRPFRRQARRQHESPNHTRSPAITRGRSLARSRCRGRHPVDSRVAAAEGVRPPGQTRRASAPSFPHPPRFNRGSRSPNSAKPTSNRSGEYHRRSSGFVHTLCMASREAGEIMRRGRHAPCRAPTIRRVAPRIFALQLSHLRIPSGRSRSRSRRPGCRVNGLRGCRARRTPLSARCSGWGC